MPDEWHLRTIAECASKEPYSTQIGPFGEKLKANNYTPTGAPVLRGTNVNPDGRFHDDDFVFIDPDWADREFSKFICEADDVILCHKGTLGKIGIVPKKSRFKKYFMGNSMMKVRCDQSKLEPLFLYYWLCSRPGQDYLFSRVSQVGVPQIQRPLSTLREAILPVPPVPEQQAIVAVLGALDDKIELNRRMNATLEAMARALFKSWFVDFDPVRAKLDGREPYGLDPYTAALFPASFQDSELGHTPAGWRILPVGDAVECVGGGTPSTKEQHYWDGGTHCWATPKDLSSLDAPILLETERRLTDAGLERVSSGLLPGGTVLLSSRAPVGYLAISMIPVAVNQGFIAMKCNEQASNYFILNWCYANMNEIHGRATGTTFAEISKKNFRPILILLPPVQLMRVFSDLVDPLYKQVATNLLETRRLATIRDALLPRLLSGQLRCFASGEREQ